MARYKAGFKNIFLCSVIKNEGTSPINKKTMLYLFKKPIAKPIAPIYNHFASLVLIYFSTIKYKTVQLSTSKELGWYNVFNRNSAENKTQVAPKINAKRFGRKKITLIFATRFEKSESSSKGFLRNIHNKNKFSPSVIQQKKLKINKEKFGE